MEHAAVMECSCAVSTAQQHITSVVLDMVSWPCIRSCTFPLLKTCKRLV